MDEGIVVLSTSSDALLALDIVVVGEFLLVMTVLSAVVSSSVGVIVTDPSVVGALVAWLPKRELDKIRKTKLNVTLLVIFATSPGRYSCFGSKEIHRFFFLCFDY